MRGDRARTALAIAALAVLTGVVAVTLAAGEPDTARWRLFALTGACWVSFAVAAWAVLRAPVRTAVPLLIIGAVVLAGVAVSAPPRSTDDYYRYAWDGRVQAAGIDPYRYTPVDPALARLRDDWLFPSGCRTSVPVCTRMNHPTSPTIYPPVAQGAFLLMHVVTLPLGPDGGGALALQVAAALLALATTGALLLLLRRRGDPRTAVLWAWCPTVVLEAANDAHIDVLAALLTVAALGAAAAGRPRRAGIAAGAAIATKLLPLLLLPALVGRSRRATIRTGVAIAGTVAAVYAPHVLVLGSKVLGFLPGYLSEEGYNGSSRFALLTPWLPDRVAAVLALLLVAGTAVLVARTNDPVRPWRGALVLVGVAFTVGAIAYPWYPMLLVVLVALDGRAEWLVVAAAAYPGYFSGALHIPFGVTNRISYAVAAAVLVSVTLLRRRARSGDADRRSGGRGLQPRGQSVRSGVAHRQLDGEVAAVPAAHDHPAG